MHPGVSIPLGHDLFSANKIFYSRIFLHFGFSFQPNMWEDLWKIVFSHLYVYVVVCCEFGYVSRFDV